jgi:hypothetical protein
VQTQHGQPCLWALVDDARPFVAHNFVLCGTGHNCDDLRINAASFVGSFQMNGGGLVFHLFHDSVSR